MGRTRAASRIPVRLALLLASLAGLFGLSRGTSAMEVEVPRFAAIAEQTLRLPAGSAVWQATEWDTFPDSADPVPFGPGFLYAPDATLSVFREGNDRATPVRPARALAVRDTTPLAPMAANDGTPTVFLAFEIVPEVDAVTPAGDPFELADTGFALRLLRATFAGSDDGASAAKPVTLDRGTYPVLLVVVSGEIELTEDEAETEVLTAGATVSVDGGISLRRSGNADALVLAVTVRGDVPDASSGAASATTAGRNPARDGLVPGAGPAPTRTPSDPTASPSPRPSPRPSPSPSPSPSSSPTPMPAGSGGSVVNVDDPAACASCLDDALDPNAQSPSLEDPDGDGLANDAEAYWGSNPNVWDTDRDSMGDGAEVSNFGTSPTSTDSDNDALTDWAEIYSYGTDPIVADGDADFLDDQGEVLAGTDPRDADTDDDCLPDGTEVSIGTSPLLQDTDGDTYWDSTERFNEGDPLVPNDSLNVILIVC